MMMLVTSDKPVTRIEEIPEIEVTESGSYLEDEENDLIYAASIGFNIIRSYKSTYEVTYHGKTLDTDVRTLQKYYSKEDEARILVLSNVNKEVVICLADTNGLMYLR